MKDAGLGEKVICQLFDPVPGDPIFLAASPERAPPKVGNVVPERVECPTVCRYRVIFKDSRIRLAAAISLVRGLAGACAVAFPPLISLSLHPHAVATGFSLQREAPVT